MSTAHITAHEPDPPAVRPGRVRRVLDRLQRFLFGYDIFVSYARVDATPYAVAIADALIQRRIAAYVDQLGTPPGPRLPALLIRRLALSSMLVLIGSRGAAASAAVRKEVIEFKRRNHRILILDVDGGLDEAEWYREEIRGGLTVRMGHDELARGTPSDVVLDRIVKGMDFTRREERLRRTMRRTVLAIAVLVAAGGVTLAFEARKVDQQRRIARALDLANQATAALDETADGLDRSALIAVESLERAWTPEGFGAWSRATQLLPRPLDRVIEAGPVPIVALRFSGDGRRIATWDSTGIVRVRDVTSGAVIDTIAPRWPVPPSSLALSADGSRVFTGFEAGVLVWDRARAPAADTLFARCDGPVESIAVGAGEDLVAFACRHVMPRLFAHDGGSWRAVALDSSEVAFSRVLAVAIRADGRFLAAGEVGGLSVWDIRARRKVAQAAAQDLWNVAFDATGDRVAAAGSQGIWLWDFAADDDDWAAVPSVTERAHWDGLQSNGPGYLSFSPDGGSLLSAGRDGPTRVWNVAKRVETHRLPADRAAAAFDPGDGTLAIADADGTVRWWAAGGGAAEVRLPLGAAGTSLAFSPDGLWLAAAADDSAVVVFDTRTWERATVLAGEVDEVWFAEDGAWLVTAGDRAVRVHEVPSWRGLAVLPIEGGSGFGTSVRVSGDWLGAVTRRTCGHALFDDARVWNVRTGVEAAWQWVGCPVEQDPERTGGDAALLEGSSDWTTLENPAVSPDGYWKADANDDVLTLSQASTGRTIAGLRHAGRVRAFAFGQGGDLLATTGEDGVVSIWRISARGRDRLVEQACARVGRRALADDEWGTFVGDGVPRATCPLRRM